MHKHLKKLLFIVGGWLSLITGIIGIVLPLLPTTPFLLLAAWCFANGSTPLHQWLKKNRYFGRSIQQWEESRSMQPETKRRAIIMVTITFTISALIAPLNLGGKVALILLGVALLLYLYRVPTTR